MTKLFGYQQKRGYIPYPELLKEIETQELIECFWDAQFNNTMEG